jgi:hypothetical protein
MAPSGAAEHAMSPRSHPRNRMAAFCARTRANELLRTPLGRSSQNVSSRRLCPPTLSFPHGSCDRSYPAIRIFTAPSESSLTVKDRSVVAIGVDRGRVGSDNGTS